MCFYDQHIYQCGDYKWGRFQQHCNKEYRTGETCGMRLVMSTNHLGEKCKTCQKIDVKQNRVRKEEERIARWQREPSSYSASISKACETIKVLQGELYALQTERARRSSSFKY